VKQIVAPSPKKISPENRSNFDKFLPMSDGIALSPDNL
jgi:hypothetical protein